MRNSYEDAARAAAYAKLEFPGTYYLAYRDLPALLAAHVRGHSALDFGCGTGRSTRFLRELGFEVVGVDIAAEMIAQARALDPDGDYRRLPGEDFGPLAPGSYDLILSAFTFDNIPTEERKVRIFSGLARLLQSDGRLVSVVSRPEIYLHEWASFSTKDYPENAAAGCGDTVRIIITAVDDRRPVEDVLWTDAGYRAVYRHAGLEVLEVRTPLADGSEPYEWVNETRIAPWCVYVLGKSGAGV